LKWRDVFATAIYAGLRKGELFGLRKTDVDLDIGVIMVQRSYDRVTTKGKGSDAIPVAAELRPYLEHALRISPSDLVPREDGTMHAETTQLEMVLRRALRRAGLNVGYRHKGRKPGCGYVEAAADPGLRECPRHKKNRRLWVTSVVRPIRFHDLRHTTGSLLTMRGANTRFVQRIMRHSDPRMTERYTHLDPAYLHGEMDALMRFQPAPVAPQSDEPTAVAATACVPSSRAPERESAPFVTRLLPEASEGAPGPLDGVTTSVGIPDVSVGAGYRVRTGDIQLGKLTLYQLS
jgi:integrase